MTTRENGHAHKEANTSQKRNKSSRAQGSLARGGRGAGAMAAGKREGLQKGAQDAKGCTRCKRVHKIAAKNTNVPAQNVLRKTSQIVKQSKT